jgi:hypothetical protein
MAVIYPHMNFNTFFANEERTHRPTLSTNGTSEDIDPVKTIVPSGCQRRLAITLRGSCPVACGITTL